MRILTKRGLAQMQAGNKTHEECLADTTGEFSVEQTPDMKVSSVAIPSLVEGDAASGSPAAAPTEPALTVADLTTQLSAANETLVAATANVETLTADNAKLTADLTKAQGELTAAQAEVAVLKPAAVTGVRSLQIKLGRATSATSAMSIKELSEAHTTLSAEVGKTFPTAQVAVADLEDNKESTPVAPSLAMVSAFSLKRNRHQK